MLEYICRAHYSWGMKTEQEARANMATTIMLMDSGIALMRQNIRRRRPGNTEEQIDTELNAWLYRTSDPIPGDTSGSVRVRSRNP